MSDLDFDLSLFDDPAPAEPTEPRTCDECGAVTDATWPAFFVCTTCGAENRPTTEAEVQEDDIAFALSTLVTDATVAIKAETAETVVPALSPPLPLVQVLPADFPLPRLTQFVPDEKVKRVLDEAVAYATTVEVKDVEGLRLADTALATVRAAVKEAEQHFEEPKALANQLHKSITSRLADWLAPARAVLELKGAEIAREQRRLQKIEDDRRRAEQEAENRRVREERAQEAARAAQQGAPAAVVEQMKLEAKTAQAPPLPKQTVAAAALAHSTVVRTWRCRIVGTPADAVEAQPEMEALTTAQRAQVLKAMQAVVEGRAPLLAFAINWKFLDQTAKAQKSTFGLPGFESYEDEGTRSKPSRRRS